MRKTTAGYAVLAMMLITGANVSAQARAETARARAGIVLDEPGSFIGATVRDPVKDELAKARLPQPGGAWIERVDQGSPAARAGLAAGDLVVEFDGERVRSARHFSRLVEETAEGRSVKTAVVRAGTRRTLELTPEAGERRLADVLPNVEREIERGMRALPRDFAFEMPEIGVSITSRGRLGANIEPLSDQLADYFGVKKGVLVASVAGDSAAARAGLRAGDVITAVDGKPVDDPQSLSERLRDATPGQVVEIGIVRDKKPVSLKATMPESPRRSMARRGRPI